MPKAQPGDIIRLDFEAHTPDGELFDTTRPAVAESAGWEKDAVKGPLPMVLGGGRILPGLEEAILDADVGAEVEVEIPPAKAFGEHVGEAVRTYPIREFTKRDIDPQPGTRVEVGGRRGTIQLVTGSRVRVDFNHPYAGLTLNYKFTVTEVLGKDEDRILALLELALGADHQVTAKVGKGKVTLTPPEEMAFDTKWFVAKHRLVHDILEHGNVDEVTFSETVTKAHLESHGHGHHDHDHDHEDDGASEEE